MYAFTVPLFAYTCGDFEKNMSGSPCEPMRARVCYEFILPLFKRER